MEEELKHNRSKKRTWVYKMDYALFSLYFYEPNNGFVYYCGRLF